MIAQSLLNHKLKGQFKFELNLEVLQVCGMTLKEQLNNILRYLFIHYKIRTAVRIPKSTCVVHCTGERPMNRTIRMLLSALSVAALAPNIRGARPHGERGSASL